MRINPNITNSVGRSSVPEVLAVIYDDDRLDVRLIKPAQSTMAECGVIMIHGC